MPDTYEIKAADGTVFEIQSDHAPTGDEAQRAIATFRSKEPAPSATPGAPPAVRRGHEAEDIAAWEGLHAKGAREFTSDQSMAWGLGGAKGYEFAKGVLKTGAPAAEKAAAIVKGLAWPAAKYEVVKHSLMAIGTPAIVAELVANAVAGRQRGGGTSTAPGAPPIESPMGVVTPSVPRGTPAAEPPLTPG